MAIKYMKKQDYMQNEETVKKQLGMKGKVEPGDMIKKAQEMKKTDVTKMPPIKRTALMGDI